MNRVILNDGKYASDREIEDLVIRRKKISENLEIARLGLEKFLMRPVDYADLDPLLKNPTGDQAMNYALKIWLVSRGKEVPELNIPLSKALVIPDEVHELLAAFKPLGLLNSKNPHRYWNEENSQFLPPDVSPDEKDKIIGRNRIYVKEGASVEMATFIYQLLNVINYSNSLEQGDFTPVMLRQTHPYLMPLVDFMHINKGTKFGSGYHVYSIKPNTLSEHGADFRAFDEHYIGQGGYSYIPKYALQ